jgi:predicted RND superfamily exporter protein
LDRLFRFIAYRPGSVLAVGIAVILVFALQVVDVRERTLRLRIQTEIEKILPEEGAERDFYVHFRELFGSYEMVFVGLTGSDVFTTAGVERIERLTRELEKLDGVRRVLSLSNAPSIRSEGDDVRVASAFDDVWEDAAELESIRARILADPMLVGNLVSDDGLGTALLVYPEDMSEREFRQRGIDQEIERVAREIVGDDVRVLMAGNPPLKATTGRILLRDLFLLVPLSFVFMGMIAFYSFRSLRGVVVPLLCIGAAQVLTLGTMVTVGRSLNLVTFIVPILINALGFAYSVHLVSEHDASLRRGKRGREAAYRALKQVAFPVFLTAITTAAGFLSLCTSRLPAIREFGAFCVVGVLGSLLVSLTLAPALLGLMGRTVRDSTASAAISSRIDRIATRVALFDLRHRRSLLVAGATVTILALIGVSQIVVSTSFVSNLKTSNPLRVSSVAFDQALGGSTTFHVVIGSDASDTFKYPENLEELRSLQIWLEQQPEVSKTNSLVDYLMVLNRAFHGEDPEYFKLPDTKQAVSQFLFFFWHDGLKDLVTPKYSSAHIMVRAPSLNSQAINAFVDRVEERLRQLPEPLEGNITGDTVLIGRTMDEIAWGQAVSLTGAIVIIYAILLVYFRSFGVALLALIPNTLPVTVYFGALGLSGVTLNIITSLIACIVLGIAVDDTIHYLVRFREKAEELGDESEAVVAALRSVARPVTSTTAALCAGFLVLAASGLRHQVEFAVLSTCMLAFAWLVDVTFTPALCARLGVTRQASGAEGKERSER